jgi:hypothetical protein
MMSGNWGIYASDVDRLYGGNAGAFRAQAATGGAGSVTAYLAKQKSDAKANYNDLRAKGFDPTAAARIAQATYNEKVGGVGGYVANPEVIAKQQAEAQTRYDELVAQRFSPEAAARIAHATFMEKSGGMEALSPFVIQAEAAAEAGVAVEVPDILSAKEVANIAADVSKTLAGEATGKIGKTFDKQSKQFQTDYDKWVSTYTEPVTEDGKEVLYYKTSLTGAELAEAEKARVSLETTQDFLSKQAEAINKYEMMKYGKALSEKVVAEMPESARVQLGLANKDIYSADLTKAIPARMASGLKITGEQYADWLKEGAKATDQFAPTTFMPQELRSLVRRGAGKAETSAAEFGGSVQQSLDMLYARGGGAASGVSPEAYRFASKFISEGAVAPVAMLGLAGRALESPLGAAASMAEGFGQIPEQFLFDPYGTAGGFMGQAFVLGGGELAAKGIAKGAPITKAVKGIPSTIKRVSPVKLKANVYWRDLKPGETGYAPGAQSLFQKGYKLGLKPEVKMALDKTVRSVKQMPGRVKQAMPTGVDVALLKEPTIIIARKGEMTAIPILSSTEALVSRVPQALGTAGQKAFAAGVKKVGAIEGSLEKSYLSAAKGARKSGRKLMREIRDKSPLAVSGRYDVKMVTTAELQPPRVPYEFRYERVLEPKGGYAERVVPKSGGKPWEYDVLREPVGEMVEVMKETQVPAEPIAILRTQPEVTPKPGLKVGFRMGKTEYLVPGSGLDLYIKPSVMKAGAKLVEKAKALPKKVKEFPGKAKSSVLNEMQRVSPIEHVMEYDTLTLLKKKYVPPKSKFTYKTVTELARKGGEKVVKETAPGKWEMVEEGGVLEPVTRTVQVKARGRFKTVAEDVLIPKGKVLRVKPAVAKAATKALTEAKIEIASIPGAASIGAGELISRPFGKAVKGMEGIQLSMERAYKGMEKGAKETLPFERTYTKITEYDLLKAKQKSPLMLKPSGRWVDAPTGRTITTVTTKTGGKVPSGWRVTKKYSNILKKADTLKKKVSSLGKERRLGVKSYLEAVELEPIDLNVLQKMTTPEQRLAYEMTRKGIKSYSKMGATHPIAGVGEFSGRRMVFDVAGKDVTVTEGLFASDTGVVKGRVTKAGGKTWREMDVTMKRPPSMAAKATVDFMPPEPPVKMPPIAKEGKPMLPMPETPKGSVPITSDAGKGAQAVQIQMEKPLIQMEKPLDVQVPKEAVVGGEVVQVAKTGAKQKMKPRVIQIYAEAEAEAVADAQMKMFAPASLTAQRTQVIQIQKPVAVQIYEPMQAVLYKTASKQKVAQIQLEKTATATKQGMKMMVIPAVATRTITVQKPLQVQIQKEEFPKIRLFRERTPKQELRYQTRPSKKGRRRRPGEEFALFPLAPLEAVEAVEAWTGREAVHAISPRSARRFGMELKGALPKGQVPLILPGTRAARRSAYGKTAKLF